MYDSIKRPINIGNITLKNRIIFAPTSMGLKENEYIKKISDIAKSKIGLIIIGDISVREGYGLSSFSLNSKDFLKKLIDIIHSFEVKASAQLYCSDYTLKGLENIISDFKSGKITSIELRKIMVNNVSNYITSLKIEDIHDIIYSFASTASLMEEVGFDMIQVHGDRMIGSFSSPIFNKRLDEYGGSVVNRAKFAFDIVNAIKKSTHDISIDFKIVGRQENPHYGNAGFLINEFGLVVPMLEKLGVSSFHVSLANHSDCQDTIPSSNHHLFNHEGCFLYLADQVKKHTKLPVCGVGHLSNPDYIEKELSSGRIDLAAMSRQFIADSLWFEKVRTENIKEIKKCIYCNQKCLGGIIKREGAHCILD